MSVRLFLPPHLEALDLGPSLDLPAERRRAAAPEWLNARHPAADRALRYARGSDGLSYEQISLWPLLEGLRENLLTILRFIRLPGRGECPPGGRRSRPA